MLSVLQAAPLNSVQDQGRPGHRGIGLCQGGAMDSLALAVANRMVGNPNDAAGLEIQTFPFRLRAERDLFLAVAGADCPLLADGVAYPSWWALPLRAGQVLEVGRPREGARSSIAVQGGIAVASLLGSRSTDLRTGFGGLDGRELRTGDRLPVGEATAPAPRTDFGIEPACRSLDLPRAEDAIVLRVTDGPEKPEFDLPSQAAFHDAPWTVTPMADRMGMRLEGPQVLRLSRHRELRSGGIIPGVVQVPPSGQPLIQLRDANAAGGYPRIAVVIEADLWRAAQLRPGAHIRFQPVSRDRALRAIEAQQAYLRAVEQAVARAARLVPA